MTGIRISIVVICWMVFHPALKAQETGAEFSSTVLRGIPREDSLNLYYSILYISEQQNRSKAVLAKADKLKDLFDFKSGLNGVTAATLNAKKGDLSNKYSDQSVLLEGLSKSALAFSGREGRIAAAHIFDLVVAMDRTQIAAAYEREKILVSEKVTLTQGPNPVTSFAGKPATQSNSNEVFVVDFSRLGISTGGGGGNIKGLAKNQSLIKGLLVQELTGSQFAGQASQMNATVLGQNGSGGRMKVRFNQQVGSMMTDAVDKMMAFLNKRHGSLPSGVEVELSFEEQYVPKDGPSAGVACTLMLDALLKGQDYSPSFAVTGAMDEKGIVGGVGGIDGKIRGAISRNCEIVAIPSENEQVIQDMLILEGPATLAKIQIVEIETFDEALKIALTHEQREESVQKAVETFKEVQGVLTRPGGMAYLGNSKVKNKLRSVVQVIPGHLSAKYLLLKGMGRNPTGLTLIGSVQAIDRNAAPLMIALQEGNFNVKDRLKQDSFGKAASDLRRLRPFLDERTRPCADAIVTFAGYVRTAVISPPKSPRTANELRANIRTSGSAVDREYKKLFSRTDVKQELMMDEE